MLPRARRLGVQERSCWAAFASHHGCYLRGRALALTHDRDRAEDLVQESMVRAMMSDRAPDDRLAFVLRCMKNAHIDQLRRERHVDPATLRIDKTAHVAAALVLATDQTTLVRNAVEVLAGDQKIIVLLKYWLSLPLREIAQLLDRPVGTVMSVHRRAIGKLRSIVAPSDSPPRRMGGP